MRLRIPHGDDLAIVGAMYLFMPLRRDHWRGEIVFTISTVDCISHCIVQAVGERHDCAFKNWIPSRAAATWFPLLGSGVF